MGELTPFSKPSSTEIKTPGADSILTVETDEDRLVLFGTLEIQRDQPGRAALERLIKIATAALEKLDGDLPETIADSPPSPKVKNPFE